MGAVHRHNFETVRKGYSPDAVDQVILELTIARNDAEALVTKLQQQLEEVSAVGRDPESSQRIMSQAKEEARRIVETAQRQADNMVARAVARDVSQNGSSEPSSVGDITHLLEIAKSFESELTKITRGALGGVGSLTEGLKQHLKTTPPAPSGVAPSTNGEVETTQGDGTIDRLRRIAAENRKQEAAAAAVPAPAPAAPPVAPEQPVMPTRSAVTESPADPADATSLAARIARQAEEDAWDAVAVPASATSTAHQVAEDHAVEPLATQEESTSLAARIARQAEEDAQGSATEDAPGPSSTAHEITDNRAAEWAAAREESTSLAARIARSTASGEEGDTDEDRGSFYSRRSARLPRIGEAAAAGALASVRSVRKSGDATSDDDDERATQTA